MVAVVKHYRGEIGGNSLFSVKQRHTGEEAGKRYVALRIGTNLRIARAEPTVGLRLQRRPRKVPWRSSIGRTYGGTRIGTNARVLEDQLNVRPMLYFHDV